MAVDGSSDAVWDQVPGRKALKNRRYAPGAFIPSVPYWPGVNEVDPQFHAQTSGAAEDWHQSPGYLHGIDLFNFCCYWEAHEAWEHIWLQLSEPELQRTHLQGLIQASACLLKIRLAQPVPAASIWKRGRARLESVASAAPEKIYWGIDIPSLIESIDELVKTQNHQFTPPRIDLIGWK